MLKEIIRTTVLLAFLLAFAFQKAGWEVSGKEVPGMKYTSVKLPNDSDVRSLPNPPAVPFPTAPFGRYTENINGVALELVRIPNGTFLMGNDNSPNLEE